MNNDRDAVLQNLFAQANKDFEDTVFTENVIARARSWKVRLVTGLAGLAVLLLAAVWLFAIPIMELAQPVSQVLMISLFDMGEGTVAWLFSPVNNIAGLLILCIKALRVAWKRFSAPF